MISLTKIILAATAPSETAAFYNAVLDANLNEIQGSGGFFRGALAGIVLIICPNSVANVDAKQNRQQLCFEVSHLTDRVQAALANGGQVMSSNEAKTHYYLIDPDGNTLELIQSA